jgi:hypothetical protein
MAATAAEVLSLLSDILAGDGKTANISFTVQERCIFKFYVNLLRIKRDDFLHATMNNFTFHTEHAGEE